MTTYALKQTHGFPQKLGLVSLAVTLLWSAMLPPAAAATKQKINAMVDATLANFRKHIDEGGTVLSKSKGLLVFPHVYQAGLGVGGEYGVGVLRIGGKTVDYYRLTRGSFGFQMGGQRKDIIIAFMTSDALNDFRKSKGWDVGAEASAAIVVVGAEGNIKASQWNEPILGFVMDQKGLMYDLSLTGSKITKIQK